MNLEDRLPELLRYPHTEAVPITAERAITGAHQRVRRRAATTGATALLLAAAGALLANQPPNTATAIAPAPPSPVYQAALGEQIPVAAGAELWLTKTDVCDSREVQPLLPQPTTQHCLTAATARPGLLTPDTYVDHSAVLNKVTIIGAYAGPSTPARIVVSTNKTSAVATIVTTPALHDAVGYFAYLPWPPANGRQSSTGTSATLTYTITMTAYDSTGHVLSTLSKSVTTVNARPKIP